MPTNSSTVTPYGEPPGQANISFPDGTSLKLTGSAWKKLAVNYTIKHDTVLEFEFLSHNQAEAHFIGFDANGTLESGDLANWFDLTGLLSLAGTKPEFRVEHRPDEVVHFHIPIGQYLSDPQKVSGVPISYLTFLNLESRAWLETSDRSDSTFSNIRLYDSGEVRTVTTYDLQGNVETEREASDPRNITTRYFYDRLSRLVQTDFDDAGPQLVRHTTVYDNVGNVKIERNVSAGTESVHEYDRLYRRIKTTLPDLDSNSATFNGLVDQFVYDPAGNLIRQVHGKAEFSPGSTIILDLETTRTIYDQSGRVIMETDGNGDETHYRHDSEGNLLSVIDAEQNETKYKYDRLNRLIEETNAFGTQRFEYDKTGNLERLYNRNGGHIQFFYDTLDRKTTEKWRSRDTGLCRRTHPVLGI